jgi:carboxyl-terminal processing protease
MKSKKILSLVLAAIIFGGGIFYAGFRVGTVVPVVSPQFANAGEPKRPDLTLFWDIVSLMKEKHINGEALTDEKVVNGAIQGAIESLGDPYSSYFPPVDAEKFNEDLKSKISECKKKSDKEREKQIEIIINKLTEDRLDNAVQE